MTVGNIRKPRPALARCHLQGLPLQDVRQRRSLAGRNHGALDRPAHSVHEMRPPRHLRAAGLDAAARGAWDTKEMTVPDIKAEIAKQIFIALQRRGADKLLSILDRCADTLSDEEVLSLLQVYNAAGKAPRYQPP